MRQPASRLLVLFLALFVGLVYAPRAFADARSDAKAHYQAGMKAYQAADYRAAIAEFSQAQQLAPADLMNYNLALCYDKLGEAEPAIQYYRAYLDKVPNATNRTEIEASVSRLEGALKSAAQKRADEAKAADDARKADEARKAEEARKAAEARKPPPTDTGTKPVDATKPPADKTIDGTGDQGTSQTPTGVGSTGTPGSAQTVSTGDAQLDRAAAIDINQIRAQRMATGAASMAPTGAGGAAGAGAAGAGAQANAGPRGTNPGNPGEPPAPTDQPKKATPVYKKWWFWVVVAISAVVVYQIATEGSNAPKNQAREVMPPSSPRAASDTGFTLLRF